MTTDRGTPKNTSDMYRTMSSRCKDSTTEFVGDECDLVSDKVSLIFQLVNFVIIVQILDLFGTGTNIINIICFGKQGLKDPSNISLLGLATSDLLSMATLIWLNICVTPDFYNADIPFDAQYISYPTAAAHHIAFTRVTCWITAFITLERCLCITLPLKIKTIMTPKAVIVINIAIYTIIYCGNIAPVFYITRFAMLPHPHKPNKTWLGIAFTEDRPIVERYSFAITNCVLPFSAFMAISVSTVVLVVKLRTKTNWRKKSTASGNSDSISSRDQSVSKMVVMISTMFIICYTPICVTFIGMIAVPEFSITGRYRNLTTLVVSFSYILESINASFNIFIYYNVSSRYRQTFRQVFCNQRSKDQNKNLSKLT